MYCIPTRQNSKELYYVLGSVIFSGHRRLHPEWTGVPHHTRHTVEVRKCERPFGTVFQSPVSVSLTV